jgi:hypothetical protein
MRLAHRRGLESGRINGLLHLSPIRAMGGRCGRPYFLNHATPHTNRLGMTQRSASARDIARQLLERETPGPADGAALDAMLSAYTRLSDNLRRAVGEDGYTALLARALSRTEDDQPVLKAVRRVDAGRMRMDLAAGVDAHGVTAVGAGLEALFTAIVEILSDLIGADMVRSLLEYHEPPEGRGERNMP